jgi:hypothetical protein
MQKLVWQSDKAFKFALNPSRQFVTILLVSNNILYLPFQKEYLQVELPYLADIRKIVTGGNVTSYIVKVSRDGRTFKYYNPSAKLKQLVCIFLIFMHNSTCSFHYYAVKIENSDPDLNMLYCIEHFLKISQSNPVYIQLFQLKLSPSKAEKSNTSAKGLQGDSQQAFRARIRLFCFAPN